ncbi:hypothetical protein QWY85_07695 [Neolewinella lacunae]|uniref:Outer membrane protein beta-barrel domain-containing protein n=1 Tax=Neolewinella lacunae TaxID=1517758 RepID=A0A923TDB8_9BACT|nr:hypothetical protein [Neolewinella lacunae]MBC6994662.1 hypothetical protein [Neolewinella lacunae]MDN3634534.1 hypothetical protein [Neolewinella lacunae]
MRCITLLPLLLILFLPLAAQNRAEGYLDVIHLREGEPLEGTILEYVFQDRVVLVTAGGSVKTVPWADILRVNFRMDKDYVPTVETTAVGTQDRPGEIIPRRSFLHQVGGGLSFGSNTANRFGFSEVLTTIGGNVNYHLVKRVGQRYVLGAGLDAGLMSFERAENVMALTALGEVHLNQRRAQPFIRLEVGPSLPFGGSASGPEISSRQISLLYHAALGLEFKSTPDGWGSLVFDLGYRFLNSSFILTTDTLDVIERNIQYRRLMLRGAIRF